MEGRSLRIARTIAGLSQEQLAKRVGISAQAISWYETGRGRMSAEIHRRLLAVLAGETDPPTPGAA